MTSQISLVLVEDNRLLRDGIAAMLNEQADLTVVGTTAGGDAVLPLVRETKPQVLLMDAALPEQDTLRLLQAVKAMAPDVRVIVMDLLPAPEEIVEFVQIGCAGFILKDATLEDFLATIRSVARGVPVLPPQLTGTIFSYLARNTVRRDPTAGRDGVRLTEREQQVVALIGDGLSNKDMAERLGIAVYTVKSHVHNVLEKLALHTRLQVAGYAHRDRDNVD